MKEWIVKDTLNNKYVQELVRCKDCRNRGIEELCIIAAVAKENGVPIFMLDDRGEWYCADGKK